MLKFHAIILNIGRILDVAVINEDTKFQLTFQIKNLLCLQLDGSLSIKEENLVNKIVTDYTNLIEQYLVRRSNGILSHMFDAAE